MILGSINTSVVAFINPLLYLLVLSITYKVFRQINFSKTYALLFTYCYSMFSPLLAAGGRMHSGDADIFVVFAYWISIFLTFKFLETKNYKYFWSLIISIMIASQIKAEGIFLIAILLFIPVIKKVKLFSLFISLFPFILWRLIIYYSQIPNDFYYIIPTFQTLLLRSFEVVYFTAKEMINVNNWYIFWPVFLLFSLFGKIKINLQTRILLLTLSMMSAFLLINYLFSNIDPHIYVSSSIDRLLLQFSPFYFIIFAMLVKNEISKLDQKVIYKKFKSMLLK